MNVPWALEKLRAFKAGMSYDTLSDRDSFTGTSHVYKFNDTQFQAAAQVCEQILDRVVPAWRADPPRASTLGTPKWRRHREWTTRAIAQLEAQAELDANLASIHR